MYPQTPPVIKPHLLLPWHGGGTADTLKEEEPLQDADRLALRISSGFKLFCPPLKLLGLSLSLWERGGSAALPGL